MHTHTHRQGLTHRGRDTHSYYHTQAGTRAHTLISWDIHTCMLIHMGRDSHTWAGIHTHIGGQRHTNMCVYTYEQGHTSHAHTHVCTCTHTDGHMHPQSLPFSDTHLHTHKALSLQGVALEWVRGSKVPLAFPECPVCVDAVPGEQQQEPPSTGRGDAQALLRHHLSNTLFLPPSGGKLRLSREDVFFFLVFSSSPLVQYPALIYDYFSNFTEVRG